MFEPEYTISYGLLSNIKRIAGLTAELNSRTVSDVVQVELEKSARAISSFSSTSIEGNPLPLTEVKKLLKSKPESLRDSEKEVLNYNKALLKLNLLVADGKTELTLTLILDIQKTITKGLIADYRCGKIRQEPVFVNDPRSGKPIYLPPDHQDVSSLLNDLVKYVQQNKSRVDPLIIAGIFHKQFVVIHPFIDGNGRTARLATKVLLADMGLNTFNLLSFENYYNKNVTKYLQKVGVFGNYYDLQANIEFTRWLEYFSDGIIDELLRVQQESRRFSITPDEVLKSYHHKLIGHIEKHGFITDKEYAKLTERAKATRSLDFRKLIEMGLIEKVGKGRSTYYRGNNF